MPPKKTLGRTGRMYLSTSTKKHRDKKKYTRKGKRKEQPKET